MVELTDNKKIPRNIMLLSDPDDSLGMTITEVYV